MRRLLSIALLLVLGLPLVATVTGRAQTTRLAACCRRGGAHHCMAMGAVTDQPMLTMTCPAFPRGSSTLQTGAGTFAASTNASNERAGRPETVGQVEAGYRISLGRAGWKRGPPTQNS